MSTCRTIILKYPSVLAGIEPQPQGWQLSMLPTKLISIPLHTDYTRKANMVRSKTHTKLTILGLHRCTTQTARWLGFSGAQSISYWSIEALRCISHTRVHSSTSSFPKNHIYLYYKDLNLSIKCMKKWSTDDCSKAKRLCNQIWNSWENIQIRVI